jgi:4-hydroxybenzoate polyprenyltransferase
MESRVFTTWDRLRGLVRTLRPHQWVKNLFVLAPLIFGRLLFDPIAVWRGFLAFLAFCAGSSAVYLINDLRDREEDRRHPRKRHRPIASGELPPAWAWGAFVLLLAGGLGLGIALGPWFLAVLGLYVVLNGLYTWSLKQVVILDVMILSLGFVLRVLGGGAAVEVRVSSWLLLCTIFVALFLAFSKRRHELTLVEDGSSGYRAVLSQYSVGFLDQMINVVTASTVIAYALYAIAPETEERYDTTYLIYTVPMVLFGIFRYLYLTYHLTDDRNPTEVILTDPPFIVNLVLWGASVVWVVYGI